MLGEVKFLTSLRGLAAGWVFFYHLNLFIMTHPFQNTIVCQGYLAVDAFFVLSGYVMQNMYKNMTRREIGYFYLKRVFRLVPLHWFILALLVLKVVVSRNPSAEFMVFYSWDSLIPVALLIQPYLDLSNHWNAASWSISIEMLCYILFSLHSVCKKFSKKVYSQISVSLISGLSMFLYYNIAVEGRDPSSLTYGIDSVIRGLLGFFAGCALGVAFPKTTLQAPTFMQWLEGKWLHWLGRLSFSIYLVHGSIISIVNHIIPPLAVRFSLNLAVWAAVLISLIFTLMLSYVTFTFIEQPGQKIPGLFRRLSHKDTLSKTSSILYARF
jgi:peptidoglycan/LPS O-acetylase OafA/YrhL